MTRAILADKSLQMSVHQYHIVGRQAPTKKRLEPKIYRMRLFAKNEVMAKSKFWYFMKKITKAKKTGGEILACNELFERNPSCVKNFAIWLRYDSRTGTHNMYKEYRDITANGAVSQMYSEMSGRHRALPSSIQIIRIARIPDSLVKRTHMIQMVKPNLKYPMIRRLPMKPRALQKTFAPKRPTTFFK